LDRNLAFSAQSFIHVTRAMTTVVWSLHARKALALSALAVLVVHVLVYIAEENPRFLSTCTRSMSIATGNVTMVAYKDADGARQQHVAGTGSHTVVISWANLWQQRGKLLARAFKSATNQNPHWWCTQHTHDRPCRNETQMLCNPKGLLFVKTPKTGSTTISHIIKRIVHNVPQRSTLLYSNRDNNSPAVCQHREDHVVGAGLWYGNRVRDESFLVTSLRDPATRAMSRFFWSYVSRNSPENGTEVQVDDDFIIDYLNRSTAESKGCTSKGQGGYQLNYISMEPIEEWSAWDSFHPQRVISPQRVQDMVNRTMQEYDFIILNERMQESLVILQFLLGLETGDLVYLSYNVGGSYYYHDSGTCKKLIKSHTSPRMQEYFQSDEEWYAKNYGDYLLFAAVNRSIDLTIIETIGRERFDPALEEFRRLETKVNDICSHRVKFPCSNNGTVLFRPTKPVPHEEIAQCIDAVIRENSDEKKQASQ
jgi:Sulfotransferase family